MDSSRSLGRVGVDTTAADVRLVLMFVLLCQATTASGTDGFLCQVRESRDPQQPPGCPTTNNSSGSSGSGANGEDDNALKEHFGLALVVSHDPWKDRVGAIGLSPSGTPVVTESQTTDVRVALEAHQLYDAGGGLRVGPFIMANTGFSEGNVVNSVGAGLMFGFASKTSGNSDGGKTLNVGIGISFDRGVKRLTDQRIAEGDGYEPALMKEVAPSFVMILSIDFSRISKGVAALVN